MSEAEVNGRAFLQALMPLKNKCCIKERLLKHFGWAVLPASLPSRLLMFDVCTVLFLLFLILFLFSFFSPPISLSVSPIFRLAAQTCEIGSVLLCAPNIPGQMDLHQVQTVTNFEPFFPISTDKCPARPGDLPCCSLPALFRSLSFPTFSSYCPGHGDT